MNVLIVGAGPVAYLFASLFLRAGARTHLVSRRPSPALEFRLLAEHEQFADLAGTFRLHGSDPQAAEWDLVLLGVPADQYAEAAARVASARCWVLPSAPFGAHLSLSGRAGEVVSISSFFGASKGVAGQPGCFSVRGRKRRVYAGSTLGPSPGLATLENVLALARVELVRSNSPLQAEARNITTYVHPALFINAVALDSILRWQPSTTTWMYKLYPQGPITRPVMETMVALWREISAILSSLGVPPLNLLQFLNDDNYPVLPESIPPEVCRDFPKLDPVDQAFWLYVRYASLLIDPFSGDNGSYHDFSAVAFPHVRRTGAGQAELPRIPFEDYRTLLLYQQVARRRRLPCPQLDTLCSSFEKAVARFEGEHQVSTQCRPEWLRSEAAARAEELCQ